ncbi:MAG: hypothetical protein IT428_17535 [Planctomycetaceae bacterium]|nr:hypothetical protein [Planctomycetaceae bacterium]
MIHGERAKKVQDLLDTVDRNLKRWRAWFPSEDSSVEVARSDLLILCDIAKVWLAIERLREPELSSVTIHSDNPDGPPNCCITVSGGLETNVIDEQHFYGDTLLSCLESAEAAMKGQGV